MRVVESYRKYYPMLRIYRDDLQHIIDIFKQHCRSITIKAGKYEVDDLEELNELHLATIPRFRITGFLDTEVNGRPDNVMLSVDLTPLDPHVSVSSAACTPLLGAATQIDQILAPRRRVLFNVVATAGTGIAGSVCFFLVIAWAGSQPWKLFGRHATPDAWLWLTLTLTASLLTFAWPILVAWLRRKNLLIINMTYSYERTSFWSRKKDDVLLALISGFIGLVIGVVTTLLLVMLTRP